MKSLWKKICIALVAILLPFFLITQICFVVDVQDTGVVTQFGNPIRTIKEPGLNFKIPFIQRVRRFDNRVLIYYPPEAEYLTRDKKNISVKIRAEADKKANIIISEAKKQADILKGAGEAEATRIYAQAIQKEPEFYKFLRTLDAYRKILDENTTLVLPGDAELMQLLNEGPNKK